MVDEQVVWFLTGSQALYGDDVLDQVAEQSRGISDALDASTTTRTFTRELRWNQAYHRLALGF